MFVPIRTRNSTALCWRCDDPVPDALVAKGREEAAGGGGRLRGLDLHDQAGDFCRGRRSVRRRPDFAMAAAFAGRSGRGVAAGGGCGTHSAAGILPGVPVRNGFGGRGARGFRGVVAAAAFGRHANSPLSGNDGTGQRPGSMSGRRWWSSAGWRSLSGLCAWRLTRPTLKPLERATVFGGWQAGCPSITAGKTAAIACRRCSLSRPSCCGGKGVWRQPGYRRWELGIGIHARFPRQCFILTIVFSRLWLAFSVAMLAKLGLQSRRFRTTAFFWRCPLFFPPFICCSICCRSFLAGKELNPDRDIPRRHFDFPAGGAGAFDDPFRPFLQGQGFHAGFGR